MIRPLISARKVPLPDQRHGFPIVEAAGLERLRANGRAGMLVCVQAEFSMSWRPDLVAALAEVGRNMRPLPEILGDHRPILAYSDYCETRAYATSTLYLTTQPHIENLVRRLEEIRASGAVESHALEYKSRKNWARLWPSSFDPWIAAFRDNPGIAVCVAFSRRLLDAEEYRALKRTEIGRAHV